MADVTKTVEIVFGATDNLSSSLSALGSRVSAFGDAAKSIVEPVNAVADAVKTVDAAVVAAGLAFGGLALQKSGEFRDQMAQIGVLSSNTSDELSKFSNDVLQYGANSTASLKDIQAALKDAIGSGVDWTKSLEFLAAAENLALGASGTLAESTGTLISTMNAYGASVTDAGKYTDILMQTVLYGKTTLPELSHTLANVTATAAAAKIPFSEVGAALAAMTAAGLPTAQAVTSLNQVISQIITPTNESSKAAEQLKVKFDASTLASEGLAGMLGKLYTATGGSVEKMGALFGSVDALKGALILGADKAGTFKTALDGIANGAGSAQKAADTLAEQWSVALQKMKNATDIMLIGVGDQLNKDGAFANILAGIKDVFANLTFSVNNGAFDTVFATLRDLAGRVSTFLEGVAKALPAALEQVDFTKFNDSLVNLFNSLSGIFDGVDLTTPAGLASVLQTVSDTIANLLNQGAGIAQTWGDLAEQLAPVVKAFSEMSDETAISSGKLLGMGDIAAKIIPVFGSLGGALEAVGTAMNVLALKNIAELLLKFDALLIKIPGAALAATGLGTALGVGGLLGAAGAAGYAVGTVLNNGLDWVIQKMTGSGSLGSLIYDVTHRTEDLANAAPKAASGIEGVASALEKAIPSARQMEDAQRLLIEQVKDGTLKLKDNEEGMFRNAYAAGEAGTKSKFLKESQEALAVATGKVKEKVDIVSDGMGGFTQTVGKSRAEMDLAAKAYLDTAAGAGHLAEAQKIVRDEYQKLNAPVTDTTKKLSNSKEVMNELATKTNITNKELIDLAKNTKEAEIKLEQIASNERIKIIESKVKLDIAEVEANAKIATAILSNLSETYKSDTGLIGELSKQLTTGYSDADRFRMRLIDDAEKRVDELHKSQMKVIDAQVEYLRAKTSALAAGNPVMTINAQGLEPHLESIMWEIFKKIQVKLSQDNGDLIVGAIT